jgi:hypothetical protein
MNRRTIWRRGEGVEPSGNRNSCQAGFEDRWGHRAPSSSVLRYVRDFQNLSKTGRAEEPAPREAAEKGPKRKCAGDFRILSCPKFVPKPKVRRCDLFSSRTSCETFLQHAKIPGMPFTVHNLTPDVHLASAPADRRARQAAKLDTNNPTMKRALEKASLRLDRMRDVLENLDQMLGREHSRFLVLRQRSNRGRTGQERRGS